MLEQDYLYDDSCFAEQYNTLLLLDKQLEGRDVKPIFHVLGGTALLFHKLNAVVTIDIDCANKLSDDIKAVVEPFISDAASDVTVLPKNYESRLVPIMQDKLKNMEVYILSIEDLVITKLYSCRFKDVEDLKCSGLFAKCDTSLLSRIIMEELPTDIAQKIRNNMTTHL